MIPRRGRSRRRSRGSTSRRRLLVLLGSSAFLGGLASSTGAFTSTGAPRPSDVDTADDSSAILGISLPPYIDAGETAQDLVTVTNNATTAIDVTVSLDNPAYGTVSSGTTIPVGGDHTFTATLDADTPGGEAALSFTVDATDSGAVNISLSRTLGVRNFLRRLQDQTQNNNALFYLTYRLQFIDEFQYYELVVSNLDLAWVPTRTYTSTDIEHIFRIPTSGTDGGTAGSTYEFDMRIYDSSGLALQRVLTDVADGTDPPDNDDIGGAPDDPRVVDFTITDETLYDNGDFTVEYEVENLTNLQEVRVTFDNLSNTWADETVTSTDAPTGTVTYAEGGVEGDTYEITVETVNTNSIVTDSLTKTDVADGDDLGGGGGGGAPGADVVDFTITDNTKNNNGKFTVDYQITSDPNHDYVEVFFDNLSNTWADQTLTKNQSPTGSVNYTQGGVEGDSYEITVRTINTSGDVADTLTKTDVADGVDP